MGMTQNGWAACSSETQNQIESLISALKNALDDDLVGIYLHGSLALGCFNPDRSDIDILVITKQAMTVEMKRDIAELLLQHSLNPAPVEISFLARAHIAPWQYPTPYDFHYSEDWREKVEKELKHGKWKKWNDEPKTDKDLAAHITVTRARGVALHGKSIAEIFPAVPEEDYIDSLVEDFHWARQRMSQHPTNFILNSCRVLAYLLDRQILSKDEAGQWALNLVAEEFRETVNHALEAYRGNRRDEDFAKHAMMEFAGHMAERIGAVLL